MTANDGRNGELRSFMDRLGKVTYAELKGYASPFVTPE